MFRRFVLVFGVVVIATSLLGGGDVWKDKPFKQWTRDDIQKIMTDSPWARQVSVAASWQSSMQTSMGTNAGLGRSSGGESMGGTVQGSSQDPVGAGGQALYIVRWGSALTVRQAIARSAELGGASEEKAEEFLKQQLETYVISVSSRDMTPFTKTDELALKQKSYLMAKKTKAKVTPDRVEIRRAPNSQGIRDVTFYFVKKSASGEVVIPADEKQVEFSCETPMTKIKTTFDLSKMAGSAGPDI